MIEPVHRAGSILLSLLIRRQHRITAFTTQPALMQKKNWPVEVVHGHALAYRDLLVAMEGQDLVIDCRENLNDAYADQLNVIDAMSANKIRTLIQLQVEPTRWLGVLRQLLSSTATPSVKTTRVGKTQVCSISLHYAFDEFALTEALEWIAREDERLHRYESRHKASERNTL